MKKPPEIFNFSHVNQTCFDKNTPLRVMSNQQLLKELKEFLSLLNGAELSSYQIFSGDEKFKIAAPLLQINDVAFLKKTDELLNVLEPLPLIQKQQLSFLTQNAIFELTDLKKHKDLMYLAPYYWNMRMFDLISGSAYPCYVGFLPY